eukprot:CAMPEP_0179208284 /NCGR_PEP_ID=MMETSP0796-20121207/103872_1 /TAXON_ID=73915 /ORGANISM="Pyrodinium bahamense, Strain pbaha01" /LENGTH=302 /DNA_ID=CAMNT_0020913233 /DNA_START=32 /DNA_END=936 /DNA_ORIENTATION=-
MDQKKLREMMRRERERRATDGGGVAAPLAAATKPGQAAAVGTAIGVPSPQKAAAPTKVVAAVPGAAGARDAAADALSMPPPPVPMRPRASGLGLSAAADGTVRGAQVEQGPLREALEAEVPPGPQLRAPVDPTAAGHEALMTREQDDARGAVDANVVASSAEEGGGQPRPDDGAAHSTADAEADGETGVSSASELPEGFFDDPELDAKVRGVEAPSVRSQRELEEGLKRFEKEMEVEMEQSEETRHELDEAKYEQVAAEEVEFQGRLQSRLLQLQEQAAAKRRRLEEATASSSADAVAGGLK